MTRFVKETQMPVPQAELFAWHEREGAIERLTPPWERVFVVLNDKSLKKGSRVHLKTKIGPIPLVWKAKHVDYQKGKEFTDIQESGPFASWKHRHQMIEGENNTSTLRDEIDYKVRFGLGKKMAKETISRMFAYRHTVMKHDLEVQKEVALKPLSIAISEESGILGKELGSFLKTSGHTVLFLESLKDESLGDVDALIHLSEGDFVHQDLFNQLENPPKVLITTSKVMSRSIQAKRVLVLSYGFVMTPKLPPLSKVSYLFQIGLGGYFNGNKEIFSWICLDDWIYHIYRLLGDKKAKGAFTLASPNPVNLSGFSKALAKVYKSKGWIRYPERFENHVFGEHRPLLKESDLPFYFPDLESALAHQLGKGDH